MAESGAHLLTILAEAVKAGIVPGVAVVAGRAGVLSVRHEMGWRQLQPVPLPVIPGTLWDLASLTKALCTSVLVMQAVGSGAVALDDPLDVAPQDADPATRAAITVRRALCHSAGFVATAPLWRVATSNPTSDAPVLSAAAVGEASRRAVVAAARTLALAYVPATRSLYSDLDFILLGDHLERRLGERLDRLATARLGPAYARGGLAFRPIGSGRVDDGAPIAATAHSPERGGISLGEVDDLNAYALGGVAGHAGLFGTVDALVDLTWALIAAYRGAGWAGAPPIVDQEVLRLFWSPAGVPGSTWRLGWDGPAAQGSLAGDRIARTAVGHLGFTGGSLWIDPARETFVAMLSNRTHPTVRVDPRFAQLRRAVNDAALAQLGYEA